MLRELLKSLVCLLHFYNVSMLHRGGKGENGETFWFQLYVMRDRDFIHRLIDRAKGVKCSALMITLDLQLMGQRHRDVRIA